MMANEQMKNLSMALKVLRAKRGWTQEDLARHSGVSISAIVFIENCKKRARVDTLVKLANAFEVDEETLLKYIY